MAAHTYRWTVEDSKGNDVLVYEGQVQGPGRVRVQTDGQTVSLVVVADDDAELEPRQVAPLVLATGDDPGGELSVVRHNLSRKKADTKPVRHTVKR
jgi:hypothetical protein